VTKFVGEFFPEFEAHKIAQRMGKRKKVDPNSLLEEWNKKKVEAQKDGTAVHKYAEQRINNWQRKLLKPTSKKLEGLFRSVDKAIKLLLEHFELIGTEIIVFSPSFGIAGIVDLIMKGKESNIFLILDWKQSKEIKKMNQFQQAFEPINHLDDCNYNKYALQLNCYKTIIKREKYYPEASNFQLGIIHLLPDADPVNIKIEDMEHEIMRMLIWQAKNSLSNLQRKSKRILNS